MQHSFDIDIAKEFGILEAVLLNNIWFWVEKNKANENNYHDGFYWTYNSTRAFAELFPYATPRKISNALKKLIDQGVLITGNYNKISYDRTLWYAFTKKGECIMQKCKMEDTKTENGSVENVEPIPDINTNIKPKINAYINIMSEAEAPDTYVVDLPTNRFNTINECYYVTDEFLNTMIELYPNTNVLDELKKMKAWLLTNVSKRKTIKGMEKFINSWLSRAQDNNKYTDYKKKNNDGWDYLNQEFNEIYRKREAEKMPF